MRGVLLLCPVLVICGARGSFGVSPRVSNLLWVLTGKGFGMGMDLHVFFGVCVCEVFGWDEIGVCGSR